MAKPGPKRLRAPSPPADLAERSVDLIDKPLTWFRLNDRNYPDPLYFSREGKYRFDSPIAKWGVCYAGSTIVAAFQEVFGDKIRRSKRLTYSEAGRYDVWQFTLAAGARLLPLFGENLAAIDATVQCFVSGYAVSQKWGLKLMEHKNDPEGLLYIGRRSGTVCIGILGDKVAPRPFQTTIIATNLGSFVNWDRYWPLMARLNLKVPDAPTAFSVPTWKA